MIQEVQSFTDFTDSRHGDSRFVLCRDDHEVNHHTTPYTVHVTKSSCAVLAIGQGT